MTDPNGWQPTETEMPRPHNRYRVWREGVGYFDATPCYGLHAPWWVPRNSFTKSESEPVRMEPTDLWQPLPDPPETP